MKKITEARARQIIDDHFNDLWVQLVDELNITTSIDEMPCGCGDPIEYADDFTEKLLNYLDENGCIADGKHFKPQAYYTGGGYWLCAMYLDDINYVVISNEDDDFGLSYYIHDEEDMACDDIEFPCYHWVKFVPLEEMTKGEILLWKSLKDELERAM